MIMLLNHFMSTFLSFLLLVQEYYDLHACFRFIPAEIFWQPIKRHQNELAYSFNVGQRLEAHR